MVVVSNFVKTYMILKTFVDIFKIYILYFYEVELTIVLLICIIPRLLVVQYLGHFNCSGKKNLKTYLTFLVVERNLSYVFDVTRFGTCRCVRYL